MLCDVPFCSINENISDSIKMISFKHFLEYLIMANKIDCNRHEVLKFKIFLDYVLYLYGIDIVQVQFDQWLNSSIEFVR